MNHDSIQCPACGGNFMVTQQDIGKSVECPSCKREIVILHTEKTRKCPYCSEQVLIEAMKCKHCGEILDPKLREQQKIVEQQTIVSPQHDSSPFVRTTRNRSVFNVVFRILIVFFIGAPGFFLLFMFPWGTFFGVLLLWFTYKIIHIGFSNE